MENPRNNSEDTDASESLAPSKKASVLDKYRRLFGRQPAETVTSSLENGVEDEDDEEEDSDKPKRWRRTFRRLFPSLVSVDEPSESQPHTYGYNPETWLNLPRPVQQETAERPAVETDPLPTIEHEAATEVTQDEPSESPDQVVRPEAVQLESDESTQETPEVSQVNRAEADNSAIYIREATQQSVNPVEREVVIQRGSNLLPVALVGMEYLGRKRADRRIKEQLTQNVDKLNEADKRSEAARSQLESIVKQNREQLEALKRDRPSVEKIVPAPQKQERREVAPAPEQIAPKLEQTPQIVERNETRRVLEEVSNAAEKDVPVERVFERSHEVKDDSSQPVRSSAASSVGAILAQQQATTQQAGTTTNPSAGASPRTSLLPSDELYQQAMKSGFVFALMVIIVGTFVYLMVK